MPDRPDAYPVRIQRRRIKGWRMPEGTIYVGRPSKWGNRYRPAPAYQDDYCRLPEITAADAVALYREHLERQLAHASIRAMLAELRGHDLCCWCPLDQPCHADVLLELANG